jgi:hypothetical protein
MDQTSTTFFSAKLLDIQAAKKRIGPISILQSPMVE